MTQRKHDNSTQLRLGALLGMILWSIVGMTEAVEATAMIPQTIVGTVEVLKAGERTWRTLTMEDVLVAGDQIRTGTDGIVDLWSDDGSTLNIATDTELAIAELDYAPTQSRRVSKLKLLAGTLTAKAKPLEFKENTFEVETSTVVAGFKFSSATISVAANGDTNIVMQDGIFDLSRVGTLPGGNVVVSHTSGGITTDFEIPPGNTVDVETTSEGLNITNNGPNPIVVWVGGKKIEVPAGASIGTSITGGQLTVTNTTDPSANIPPVKVQGRKVSAGGTRGVRLPRTNIMSRARRRLQGAAAASGLPGDGQTDTKPTSRTITIKVTQ